MHIRLKHTDLLRSKLWRFCRWSSAPAPQSRGFTLLHLLAVIAIAGALCAMAIPTLFSIQP